jgi:membrane protease YdiL (CAAX protease family)
MARFNRFAVKRPFLFGLVLILIYSFLGTITYPIHFLFPETGVGQLYGDAAAKLVIFAVFVLLLWRFGWLRASGLTSLRPSWGWLLFLGLFVFKLFGELYAFTGDIALVLPSTPLTTAEAIYPITTSLVEETISRALVLTAMLLAWGNTKKGIVKSVILSSLLFGLIHLFNIIVRPPSVVLLQAAIVSLPGIFYAAIVLKTRSLWPPIIFHWISNAAVNIKLAGVANYRETPEMWITFALVMIPLMVYSAYVLWRLKVGGQKSEVGG